MKGIILAAGRGSRMGDLTKKLPKCRSLLHGKELIQWQIDAMEMANISDISIVRGYLSETFTHRVKYFENNRWFNSNMVTSLIQAKEWLNIDNCIISYSDIVYSVDTLKRLIDFPGDIVIAYDPNWLDLWKIRFDNPLNDAETFKLDGAKVIEIGNKASSVEEIEGQYMGLLKFTPKGWKEVESHINMFAQEIIDKIDITKLLQELIKSNITINAVAIKDKWFEVDSEEDLNIYNTKYTKNPFK